MADNPPLRRFGRLACIDSGPVAGTSTYTTLVMIHGYGWHSAGFRRLLAFAPKYQVRVVPVNRPDFPGSAPYTAEERALYSGTPEQAPALLDKFMRGRAQDLIDFLSAFVEEESIPKKNGIGGGVIVTGWSLGSTWITALLAHAPTLSAKVDLTEYIQRGVLYDPPALAIGFPFPARSYSPLYDEAIPPNERSKPFAIWVSGYWTHGDTEESLSLRHPDTDRTPSIATMTDADVAEFFDPGPAAPGGSDNLLLMQGLTSGVNARNLERTVFRNNAAATTPSQSRWLTIPLRYVGCDRSGYEMTWCKWRLEEYLEKGRSGGRAMRHVSIACLEGANHFAHRDEPGRLLQALLAADEFTGFEPTPVPSQINLQKDHKT